MKNNDYTIGRRDASRISAAIIIVGFFLFVAGYIIGRRRGLQEFMQRMEKESLTDQVYSAISSLYDNNEYEPDEAFIDDNAQTPEVISEEQSVNEPAPPLTEKVNSRHYYYGQLASFRRIQDAELLVKRLKKHGIIVQIKEITSSSRQGRSVKWFQVITTNYSDREALEQLITIIKELEKIHDVVIREVKK